MKSKVALKNIKKFLKEIDECTGVPYACDYQEEIKTIKKDLEVLKTLKKYLIIATNPNDESQSLTFDRHIFNDDIDTEADFYLIKEWLENE